MAQRIKKQLFRILPLSVVGLMVLAVFAGTLYNSSLTVLAAAGEGTATIADSDEGAGLGVTAERTISEVFTVVLTVGANGIAIDADSPTFAIPASLTAPHANGGAVVPTNAGEVDVDGEWYATAAGGTCAVTMGSSSASGQIITIDVTGACVNTDTITLTYQGVSATNMGATALTISTDDVSGGTPAAAIGVLPTITVTDTIVPTISAVSIPDAAMNVNDVVTATITTGTDSDTYTLTSGTVGGFTLGALSKTSPTTYTATFTITDNGTNVAAGANVPVVNLVLTDSSTNPSAAFAGSVSPAGASDSIDANLPVISAVTIPDAAMKVGDVVTATITVDDDTVDGGQPYVLTSGTIGGFTLGALARTNATTYTATFTIADNGTNVAAGANIPTSNIVLTDTAGNPSAAYATAIVQAADPIDANLPVISAVTIPDAAMKVGDVVTATITVDDDTVDGGQPYVLTSGTIGGFTLGALARTNATTYTATFTIA
ncbi:MAG: hypothetical protein WC836_00225, partial [Desulfobacula sp.]